MVLFITIQSVSIIDTSIRLSTLNATENTPRTADVMYTVLMTQVFCLVYFCTRINSHN